jgi:hypothetical protein
MVEAPPIVPDRPPMFFEEPDDLEEPNEFDDIFGAEEPADDAPRTRDKPATHLQRTRNGPATDPQRTCK